mmetsp:Transcript_43371/g.97674  ORF Transcript_43371/g.97674 Transcript_43371/m.97674 type:complete len:111 (-) Transcript_43371:982-1314(-)
MKSDDVTSSRAKARFEQCKVSSEQQRQKGAKGRVKDTFTDASCVMSGTEATRLHCITLHDNMNSKGVIPSTSKVICALCALSTSSAVEAVVVVVVIAVEFASHGFMRSVP